MIARDGQGTIICLKPPRSMRLASNGMFFGSIISAPAATATTTASAGEPAATAA